MKRNSIAWRAAEQAAEALGCELIFNYQSCSSSYGTIDIPNCDDTLIGFEFSLRVSDHSQPAGGACRNGDPNDRHIEADLSIDERLPVLEIRRLVAHKILATVIEEANGAWRMYHAAMKTNTK